MRFQIQIKVVACSQQEIIKPWIFCKGGALDSFMDWWDIRETDVNDGLVVFYICVIQRGKHFLNNRAGEIGHDILAVLAEDKSSVSSNHMVLIIISNSNSKDSNALFCPFRESGFHVLHIWTCRETLIHIKWKEEKK